MKAMLRLTLLALVLVLALGSASPVRAAEIVTQGTCGENLTWMLTDDGTLTISGSGEMSDYYRLADRPWDSVDESITTVVIEDGVTSIGNAAFAKLTSLTSVTIPDSVKRIGYSAFEACNGLTGVTIPDSVTTIGSYAFGYCKSLTSVRIPASVTFIDVGAFGSCDSLTGIWVDEVNPNYSSDQCGVLFDKQKSELLQAPSGIKGTYEIPRSVVSVGYRAFGACTGLTGVSIPNSVTNIKSFSFALCTGLTDVKIPDSVTTIESSAFAFCDGLTSVTIPSGVTYIGSYAFEDCRKLAEVIFMGDAPIFGSNPFYSVAINAYYPAGNATWTADVMQQYGGTITWMPFNASPPAVPAKPYKITNVVSGVHVYWKTTEGAVKYGLWRSETGVDGTYKWIANPTVPHFTDTTAVSGKTYYYKVTAMNFLGTHSAKSAAIGITYVGTPDITSRFNKAAGITLGWEKIPGATGYAIYRKSYYGNDAWVRVATISGNSTFTWQDTSVANNNGVAYKYTIRALAGSDMKTLSGCRNAGRTMVRLTSRTLTSAVKASSASITCKWNTSSAVTGYEVRFMVGDEVYKTFTIGNYKIGTKTFTGLPTGCTYKIQVRSYVKIDGMGFYSAWSTAKYLTL